MEVAEAYVTLIPSAQGFQRNTESALAGPLTGAGRQGGRRFGAGMTGALAGMATKVFAPLAAAAAGAGLLSFFKDAVNGASDLNEAMSATSVIFGSGAGAVQKFAAGAAKGLGQTQVQALDAAKTFGTFGKAAGLSGTNLSSFSTDLVSLATDLASFNNTSPEQAIEAIGAALRGESEPIRSYGVLLDDASMRQEALRLGLIKTTKSALTPQQKVLAAQSLIYKQTADAQGDFARTSGGLANQQRILSAQWSELKTKLGQALLPAVGAVARALNNVLGPAMEALGPLTSKVGTAIGGLFALIVKGDFTGGLAKAFGLNEDDAIIGKILDLRDSIIGNLRPVFASIATYIQTALLPALRTIGGVIVNGIGPIFSKLASFVQTTLLPVLSAVGQFIFSTLLPPLLKLYTFIYSNLLRGFFALASGILSIVLPVLSTLGRWLIDYVIPALTQLIAWIEAKVTPAFQMLGDYVNTTVVPAFQRLAVWVQENLVPALQRIGAFIMTYVVPALSKAIAITGQLVGWFIRVAGTILGTVIPPLVKFAVTIIGKVVSAIATGISWVTRIIVWLANFAVGVTRAAVSVTKFAIDVARGLVQVVTFFAQLPGKVVSALSGMASRLYSIGSNIVQGLINGIRSMAGAITRALLSILPGPLRKFAGALGIMSPSKVFQGFGEQIGAGLVVGIASTERSVRNAVVSLASTAASVSLPATSALGASNGAAAPAQIVFAGPVTTTDVDRLSSTILARQRDALALATVGVLV